MKITVQEKIAELESRIAALEGKSTRKVEIESKVFGKHWNNMWKEFHLVMKEVFE